MTDLLLIESPLPSTKPFPISYFSKLNAHIKYKINIFYIEIIFFIKYKKWFCLQINIKIKNPRGDWGLTACTTLYMLTLLANFPVAVFYSKILRKGPILEAITQVYTVIYHQPTTGMVFEILLSTTCPWHLAVLKLSIGLYRFMKSWLNVHPLSVNAFKIDPIFPSINQCYEDCRMTISIMKIAERPLRT